MIATPYTIVAIITDLFLRGIYEQPTLLQDHHIHVSVTTVILKTITKILQMFTDKLDRISLTFYISHLHVIAMSVNIMNMMR